MKIIEKLSTYAALIGVIGAIGGGFYTWGQFNTRLDAIESAPSVDLSPLKEKDKELNAKVDSALLYANEYKVDLIDRIAKVEEQIKPTDLTSVFKEIGKIREQIAMLPEPANLQPILEQLQMLEEYGWELEEDVEELSKQVAIVAKENELQSIQIEEVKTLNSNPLGG
jgi:regulator of replication initiation timing